MKKYTLFSIGAFVLGVAVLFCVIELSLRLFGFAYLVVQDFHNKNKLSSVDHYRILCIGESTTATGGEHSYPSQLEALLNARSAPQKKFSVINKGIPGEGGDYILRQLDGWIEEYRPHIIVAMMGINDRARRIPLQEVYCEEGRSLLCHLRTVKFFKWLRSSLGRRLARKVPAQTAPESTGAGIEAQIPPPVKNMLESPEERKMLATAHQLLIEARYDEAEKIFYLFKKQNIGDPLKRHIQEKLIFIYEETRQYDKLKEILRERFLAGAYDFMGNVWLNRACKDKEGLRVMVELMEELIADNPEYGYRESLASCYQASGETDKLARMQETLGDLYDSSIDKVVLENYIRLIDITRKRGVRLVIMEYPTRNIAPLRGALKTRAGIQDIAFVENKRNFEEFLQTGRQDKLFVDYFAGSFGHCTPAGNRLIAQNLARVLFPNN